MGDDIDASPADRAETADRHHGTRTARRSRDDRPAIRTGLPRRGRGAPARVAPLTGQVDGRPRARLYDANGQDRDIDLAEGLTKRLGKSHLLWIDIDRADSQNLEAAATALALEPTLTARLTATGRRPDLTKYPDHLHLALRAVDAPAATSSADEPGPRIIDVVGGRDWVLTVHDGPAAELDRLDATTEGETRLGAMDAAGFVAAIADEVLTEYLATVEAIEREIDHLDERAMKARRGSDVLPEIVAVRRRIGRLRRALAPQRVAFAALARPEMALDEDFGEPWPGLTDRLDRTIDSVENLRAVLLGTFDIQMGRAAKDANDVMKLLTIVSAVFLPGVVLAGIMGMNFQLGFFDNAGNFWVVITAMVVFAVLILGVARWRRWL